MHSLQLTTEVLVVDWHLWETKKADVLLFVPLCHVLILGSRINLIDETGISDQLRRLTLLKSLIFHGTAKCTLSHEHR